jgi:hypothetical protein
MRQLSSVFLKKSTLDLICRLSLDPKDNSQTIEKSHWYGVTYIYIYLIIVFNTICRKLGREYELR